MSHTFDALSGKVIGYAIEVHRTLGPGLLESVYEECLTYELKNAGLKVVRQVPVPVIYKEVRLDLGYRMDLLVESSLVVELKSVEVLLPIHEAQILTHMRFAHIHIGLLMNFKTTSLRKGLKRFVL